MEKTSWPSRNHRVVCLFHSISVDLDVPGIVKNIGTVTGQTIFFKDDEEKITKIEMSNSKEAKVLWETCKLNPPTGVLWVAPDKTFKTLQRFYLNYWSNEQVNKGIKDGEIIVGALRINPKNFHYAYVSPETGKDILIDGLNDRNRALDGDIVAIKVHSNNELQASNRNLKTGKVVAVIEKRHSQTATGYIKREDRRSFSKSLVTFLPVSKTFPQLFLHRSCLKGMHGSTDFEKTLFIASFEKWSVFQNSPIGKLIKMIGKKGEIAVEAQRLIIDNGIDDTEFSKGVLDSFSHSGSISCAERSNRKDFTEKCIFSIDLPSTKDLDDALHCEEISPDVHEVGVHIADVSHFVKPGTEVDLVASRRGTSVYLAEKVIPMLPCILSEEVCSLKPGFEKLAISLVFQITGNGEVLSVWIGKSIIKSCTRLSYDQAQLYIDNPDKDFTAFQSCSNLDNHPEILGSFSVNTVKDKVVKLSKIAQNLQKQRLKNGALHFADHVELSFTLSDLGLPTSCSALKRKESDKVVEEFMLLANKTVAQKIHESQPDHAFLRCQHEPRQTATEDFVSYCKSIGLNIDSSSSGALSQSIEQCSGNDEMAVFRKNALSLLARKGLQSEHYFCAGTKSKETFRHYTLNIPVYAHFTSPIRRYADIIVHRQLAKALRVGGDAEAPLQSPEVLQKQAQLCNYIKRKSRLVQRQNEELFFSFFVENYGPLETNAVVLYVNKNSIDVFSVDFGIKQRIFLNSIPGLVFQFKQKQSKNTLVLKWIGQRKGDHLVLSKFVETVNEVIQTIEVFSVVKILFQKLDKEAATYNTVLKRPG